MWHSKRVMQPALSDHCVCSLNSDKTCLVKVSVCCVCSLKIFPAPYLRHTPLCLSISLPLQPCTHPLVRSPTHRAAAVLLVCYCIVHFPPVCWSPLQHEETHNCAIGKLSSPLLSLSALSPALRSRIKLQPFPKPPIPIVRLVLQAKVGRAWHLRDGPSSATMAKTRFFPGSSGRGCFGGLRPPEQQCDLLSALHVLPVLPRQ
eukprot:COSAG06_NODE_6842_length_2750_cov_15.011694_2_plen_203_part_00